MNTKNKISKMSKRDFVFSILFFIVAFLFIRFVLGKLAIGFTISFLALFVVATLYLFKKNIKVSKFTAFCGGASIICSLGISYFDSIFTNLILLFLTITLFVLYTCGISGTFKNNEGSFKILFDAFFSFFIAPIKNAFKVFSSINIKSKNNKNIIYVIAGILISIPVLGLVIIPLLVSSDDSFKNVVNEFINSFYFVFSEFASYLFCTIILGAFFVFYFYVKKEDYDTGSKATVKFLFKNKFSNKIIAISFLGIISFVYIIYLYLKTTYFFSAFSGNLPNGYDYSVSKFARQGFYEMVVIAVINIVLVCLVNMFTKIDLKEKSSKVLVVLECFISCFSILILITSTAKMVLNVKTFGLTKSRLFVFALLIILFAVLVTVVFHIIKPQKNYMQFLVVFCSVVLMMFSFCNADNLVAKYNVEMYKSGNLENIDINYLSNLKSSGVKYLIELTNPELENKIVDDSYDMIYINSRSSVNTQAKAELKNRLGTLCLKYDKEKDLVSLDTSYLTKFDLLIDLNLIKLKASKEMANYYNSLNKVEKDKIINYEFSYYDEKEDELEKEYFENGNFENYEYYYLTSNEF